tara:strand:- start:204 stop:1319 length:1116 start_codon:yes stop_codon:yes gene_type:complete
MSKKRRQRRKKPKTKRPVVPDFSLTPAGVSEAKGLFGDRPVAELTLRMVAHHMVKANDSEVSPGIVALADPDSSYYEAVAALKPSERRTITARGYRLPKGPKLNDADCQQMIRDTIAKEGSPDWPTLRLIAAKMLDQNPNLAAAMEAEDLDKVKGAIRADHRIPALASARKRIDQEASAAIRAMFTEDGFDGTLYTMASQFHHPDWVERDKNAPPPDGPTRTLYHFTSAIHLPVVLEYGIERGDVCLTPGDELKNYNAPWLTSNPSFHEQGWAEHPDGSSNSTFDKRAVRLTVSIPEGDSSLSTWEEVCEREGVPDFWRKAMNATGGKGDTDWFVYNARIPRSWINAVEYREKVSLETGRYGIARLGDLSP